MQCKKQVLSRLIYQSGTDIETSQQDVSRHEAEIARILFSLRILHEAFHFVL